jgi:hypothetical protein
MVRHRDFFDRCSCNLSVALVSLNMALVTLSRDLVPLNIALVTLSRSLVTLIVVGLKHKKTAGQLSSGISLSLFVE